MRIEVGGTLETSFVRPSARYEESSSDFAPAVLLAAFADGAVFCSFPEARWAPAALSATRSSATRSSLSLESETMSMDRFPKDSSSSSDVFFLSFREKKLLIALGFLSLSFLSLSLAAFFLSLSETSSLSSLSRLDLDLPSLVIDSDDSRGVLSSRNRFGVSVIFLVSTVSSLKKLSVLRTVPFLDLLGPSSFSTISSLSRASF